MDNKQNKNLNNYSSPSWKTVRKAKGKRGQTNSKGKGKGKRNRIGNDNGNGNRNGNGQRKKPFNNKRIVKAVKKPESYIARGRRFTGRIKYVEGNENEEPRMTIKIEEFNDLTPANAPIFTAYGEHGSFNIINGKEFTPNMAKWNKDNIITFRAVKDYTLSCLIRAVDLQLPKEELEARQKVARQKAAREAAERAARAAREAAREAARAAAEAARRAKEAAARAAREAARKAKEIAEKAKNAVKKGLDSLGGLSASQIRKLTAMFKKQQQALEAGRKAQQAAAERAQKAQWADEERRDAAERARMEAELARGKKDDSIKTPQPKFEDKDVKEINVGKGMSKDLGDSNKYKPPSINTKMDVTMSKKSQEFEKPSNPDWEDFMNIGPTQSFKISYIVIILLLIFLYYTYTK